MGLQHPNCPFILSRTWAVVVCFQLWSVASLTTRSSLIQEHQKLPYVGLVKRCGITFTVVGTSHFQCKSASEITSLIRKLNPDGVVVELDPERTVQLTKEATRSNSTLWFGADFQAAIDTARELDIPLFVGDEYTKETKARFLQTMFTPASYSPRSLVASMLRSNDQVDLVQTFADDPMKLMPLLVTFSIPLIAIVVGAMLQGHGALVNFESLRSNYALLSLMVSFFGICKVYNTLIADRDEVLVNRAIQASNVVWSLKTKETIRKSWTFPVEQHHHSTKSQDSKLEGIPLFTLKRPLDENTTRSLYLFEPRWLAMVDSLGSTRVAGNSPQFGCLTCVNKFYCTVSLPGGREGKYADVIFKRQGRMASIKSKTEGKRPSGDRKVTVLIEGKAAFSLDEGNITVKDSGYLMATALANEIDETGPLVSRSHTCDADVSIVVVVGLLHANGVIEQLRIGSL